MIEGFEELKSTQIGRQAEELVRGWLTKNQGWSLEEDSCNEYDPYKDLKLIRADRSVLVEVKGDNFPSGRNIALEYMQQGLNGEIRSSGIAITESEYIAYYVFRWDTLYIFTKQQYDMYVELKYINADDSKLCNTSSKTGKTYCYVLDACLLERDEFFCGIVENLSSADKLTYRCAVGDSGACL